MRRRVTRRPTMRQTRLYEEEEEGYVSGEYEDGPFELIKIRVKVGSGVFLFLKELRLIYIFFSCSFTMKTTSGEWR
jgi:hypothetical protein